MAQLIHHRSRRPEAPFLDINCGALPEHLVEAGCLATRKAHSLGRYPATRAISSGWGPGPCFWTKLANCLFRFNPSCCVCLKRGHSVPWGRPKSSVFPGGWWQLRTAIWLQSKPVRFGKTCTTAWQCLCWMCRVWINGGRHSRTGQALRFASTSCVDVQRWGLAAAAKPSVARQYPATAQCGRSAGCVG